MSPPSEQRSVPALLVRLAKSWIITNVIAILGSGLVWSAEWEGFRASDWLKQLPFFAAAAWTLLILYAVLGAFCLYVLMWAYWAVLERSSWGIRTAWLLAMVFGLHIGAIAYALKVWRVNLHVSSQKNRVLVG